MNYILTGMILVLLIVFGIRSYSLYQVYQGTIYQVLFPNFISYAYQMFIRKDLSKSRYFEQKFSAHRIIYQSVLNSQGKEMNCFVLLITNQGIFLLSMLHVTGTISGKSADKYLLVSRENKVYRFDNPLPMIEKQTRWMEERTGQPIIPILVFGDGSDLRKLKSKVSACSLDHLMLTIQETKASELISNDLIQTIFKRCQSESLAAERT